MVNIKDEFSNCEFGDQRLTKRVSKLAEVIFNKPEFSINAACASYQESKAAYRFFENTKVTSEKILLPHQEKTMERINNSEQDIILIQDTTEINYTHFPSIEGLGRVLKTEKFENVVQGLFVHTTLVASRNMLPLGILCQSIYTHEDYKTQRNQTTTNETGINKTFPITEKESFRWIDHFRKTKKFTNEYTGKIIHTCDREADIYELLQEIEKKRQFFVIRSLSNRMTKEGTKSKDRSNLLTKLASVNSVGRIEIELDSKIFKCNVKFCNVKLNPPQRKPEAQLEKLVPQNVTVVEVKSIEVDETQQPILYWRLITNLEVSTFEACIEIIEIYRIRWMIESFHRILKSGFGVEKSRLGNRNKLEKLITILSIVSWFLFWLMHLGRSNLNTPMIQILGKTGVTVIKATAKEMKIKIGNTPSINEFVLLVSRLGGFKARKGDGPPGMMNLWRGWRSFCDRVNFYDSLTYG